MSNTINEYNDYSDRESDSKSALLKLVIFIAIILYLYSIFFGEYSLGVMLDAKAKKEQLQQEYNTLQQENQKLQKKHFELIQLTPSEDAF